MAKEYRVNGKVVTKAQYDQFQFKYFGGPDPNIKKERPAATPATPARAAKRRGQHGIPKFPEPHQANDLKNFIASINTDNGYALEDKFEAIIYLPPKMSGSRETNPSSGQEKKFDINKISLRIESINLPGRNLDTTSDTNIYGPTREVVNGVTYAEDISVVFLASGDLKERKFFEEWQNQAINPATWDIGYYNDYVGIIEIYLMDKNGLRKFGLKLHEAFPKTIGPTPLSSAQKNSLIRTEVSFTFRYWTPIAEIEQKPTLQHSIGRGSHSARRAQILGAHYQNLMNIPATKRLLGR